MDYQKKKQLHILVQLALADNNFTESEKNAIRRIGLSYDIAEDEIESIISNPEMQESLAPMEVSQKMDFLIDSMAVLLADKEIHESEDRFIRSLASKLGFKDPVITFLMEYHTMERHPLKDMMLKYLA
jgi:uncharacterized tellurite resistance protein B-like protein